MNKRIIICSQHERTQELIWDTLGNYFGKTLDNVIPDPYKAIPLISGLNREILVVYDNTLMPNKTQYLEHERKILRRVLEISNNNCDGKGIPHVIYDSNDRRNFEQTLDAVKSKIEKRIKLLDDLDSAKNGDFDF